MAVGLSGSGSGSVGAICPTVGALSGTMGGEVAEIVIVAPEPRHRIGSFFIRGVAADVAATVTMLGQVPPCLRLAPRPTQLRGCASQLCSYIAKYAVWTWHVHRTAVLRTGS